MEHDNQRGLIKDNGGGQSPPLSGYGSYSTPIRDTVPCGWGKLRTRDEMKARLAEVAGLLDARETAALTETLHKRLEEC
ncbi:MAG: hypothetical protein M1818_004525 [Claussenomyces sp. TS43310]|nr:MAG: hypothetical protein M1818_004525 [Claussenomyces sp. TS43310]